MLEAGQADFKKEMTKLRHSEDVKSEHQKAHSVLPQHSSFSSVPKRRIAEDDDVAGNGGHDAAAWKIGFSSFRHSLPLQRESRSHDLPIGGSGGGDDVNGGSSSTGPLTVNFTDRQYLNILQSIGQSVHIFDINGLIIY